MKHCLPLWLLLLLMLQLPGAARATAGPPATGRPLAEALNPDGTLRAGAAGSFDARQFRMQTAPDGRPVFRPAGTKGASDERWADGFGLPDGTNGSVEAVVRSGADIYIGGYFTAVGRVAANCVAKWNGTAWSALGPGLGSSSNLYYVEALAVAPNGDLYAGGYFDQAGGAPANYVARWNGTVWNSLGGGAANGVNNTVYALAVASNGDVYAGGDFTQAGGISANRVARWNGTGWSSLGSGAANGVNNTVYALAAAGNGSVYVGGDFDQAGGMPMLKIAQWDGATWNPLDSGVNSGVLALAVAPNGDLYAGGYFNRAGSVAAGRIARWDGTRWNTLGAGLNNTVYTIAVAGSGDVYAGGDFGQAGNVSASGVARWTGTAWSSLGLGVAGVSGQIYLVNAVAVAGNGEVYVGGAFSQVAGAAYFGIASWNGSSWNTPGAGPGLGVSGTIEALAVAGNGDVYAAGSFLRAGGTMARNVAQWNGTAWASLGTGTANGIDLSIHALAVAPNGDVYAGGYFRTAGGVPALNVAKWDGNRWSALGTGLANPLNNAVLFALAVAPNGDVYAGGRFTEAGGIAANNVARWNGTTWSALGTGATNGVSNTTNSASVLALTMAGNDLYVGGEFTQAGGVAANNVARWNGTVWSPLGTSASNGVQGYVAAFAVAGNGDVYTGGGFTLAGGTLANNVARWNGTAWSALGAGVSNNGGFTNVGKLALAANGDLYAGGYFVQAGSVAASHLAKWNGTAWSSLGTGISVGASGLRIEIPAIAVGPNNKVYVGGNFTTVGDGSKIMVGFGIYDPAAPLATAAAKAAPAVQLFPNPAHGTATLRLPATAVRQPVTLSDGLGRLVRQYPAPAGPEAVLDLRGLPAGTYLVRCGELTQRLVVE